MSSNTSNNNNQQQISYPDLFLDIFGSDLASDMGYPTPPPSYASSEHSEALVDSLAPLSDLVYGVFLDTAVSNWNCVPTAADFNTTVENDYSNHTVDPADALESNFGQSTLVLARMALVPLATGSDLHLCWTISEDSSENLILDTNITNDFRLGDSTRESSFINHTIMSPQIPANQVNNYKYGAKDVYCNPQYAESSNLDTVSLADTESPYTLQDEADYLLACRKFNREQLLKEEYDPEMIYDHHQYGRKLRSYGIFEDLPPTIKAMYISGQNTEIALVLTAHIHPGTQTVTILAMYPSGEEVNHFFPTSYLSEALVQQLIDANGQNVSWTGEDSLFLYNNDILP
jgi:hypothetical protein